jgi:hypothetical protein
MRQPLSQMVVRSERCQIREEGEAAMLSIFRLVMKRMNREKRGQRFEIDE